MRGQELGRLERRHPVQADHLVERAIEGALGGGAVVADDHVDQGVVHDPELLDRVEQPPHVVVDVRHEASVDLHLALEDRLEILGHVVPGRDLLMPLGEVGVLRDDAQLLLPGEGALALFVPAVGEAGPCTSRSTPWARGAGRASRRARST